MRTLLAVVVVLGSCAVASAQTHPCDTTGTQIVVKSNETFGIGFCHDGKDTSGTVQPITKFRVVFDGIEKFNGPLTPIGAPNAVGKNYYETPKTFTAPAGNHSAAVFTSNAAGEGAAVNYPFTVTAVATVPSSATVPRLIK